MAKLDQVVTGDKLLYHDKEFKANIEKSIPKNTSQLVNDDHTVKDENYIHTDSNYTTAEKDKLAGVDDGAQANVIESVKVNGAAQTVTDKGVDITVPTGKLADKDTIGSSDLDTDLAGVINGKAEASSVPTKVGDLTNDKEYQTKEQVSSAINTAVANSQHLKRKNVTALPTEDIDSNTIYMVPDPNGKSGNTKIEYMYDADTSSWEQVGSSETDLDGYVKNDDLTEITNTQVDGIIAQVFGTTKSEG